MPRAESRRAGRCPIPVRLWTVPTSPGSDMTTHTDIPSEMLPQAWGPESLLGFRHRDVVDF